jgi:hypothetical protein
MYATFQHWNKVYLVVHGCLKSGLISTFFMHNAQQLILGFMTSFKNYYYIFDYVYNYLVTKITM